MCAVCRKNPCDSRCPNAEEPKSIYTCEWCNGTYGDNKPDSVPELEAQDPFEVVEEEPEDVDIDAM